VAKKGAICPIFEGNMPPQKRTQKDVRYMTAIARKLLTEQISIFRLVSLYRIQLYPWRFDSIHSHCNDDMISILNILKNFHRFWAIAHLRGVLKKKTGLSGTSPTISISISVNISISISISISGNL
jgi:hypothetical protein